MKSKLLLLLIILFTFILTTWKINELPSIISSSSLPFRYLSSISGIASVFTLFVIAKIIFKNRKLALLISWVFSSLPWFLEQSRIASQPNYALFFFLLSVLFSLKVGVRY